MSYFNEHKLPTLYFRSTGLEDFFAMRMAYYGDLKLLPIEDIIYSDEEVLDQIDILSIYGLSKSILTDEEGHVIAGEWYCAALLKKGCKQVPVVVMLDLSTAQKLACREAYQKMGGRND